MNMLPGSMNTMQVGQVGHVGQQPQHVIHGGTAMQPGMGGHAMHMGSSLSGVMGQQAPNMMIGGSISGGHMVGLQQMQQGPHPQLQQQQQFLQQQQSTPEQIDSLSKVKLMIPQLKEALNRLTTDAGVLLNNNLQEDTEKIADSGNLNKLEKSLEKFHNICDIMELNLKLSMEVLMHNSESRKYVPCNVSEMSTTQQSPDVLTYPQYVSVVKSQNAFAQEIKDLLTNCAKKVNKHTSLSSPSE